MWGSALTDHAVKENHIIDWESAKIVEKEREDLARGIKEATYIRKLPNLNRDEGRYHRSHLYDNLLGAAVHAQRGRESKDYRCWHSTITTLQ